MTYDFVVYSSDVWSLGITLIEVSTGQFPYPKWNSVFEQLQQVVHGDPPSLDPRENGKCFTIEFVNFVNTCLIKDELQRPKYNRLLEHPFIRRSESEADSVNVAEYINRIVDQWDTMPAGEGEGSFMDCSSPWSTNT
jgi:mitogen-activated protein kinase kinase 4